MQRIVTLTFLILFHGMLLASTQQHRSDNATGAQTWETRAHGVTFSLTQILPDQARAFYVNRGFSLDMIEEFANACIYMTVLRNDTAPGPVHFIQQQWSVVTNGDSRPPLDIENWLEKLTKAGASKPALIAFRWAQFPPEQEYEPGGDWNQGMLTTGLPPGSRFDMIARWDMNGKDFQATLKDVQCAE